MTNGPITRVPVPPMPRTFLGAGLTHCGLVRTRNEDAILSDPPGAIWAVADGMGGYGYGDVAADLVIDELMHLENGPDPPALLRRGLDRANARVCERAAHMGPMGATVVVLVIRERRAHVAWAGDSRAYLYRQPALHPLTRDHSIVRELVDRGELDASDAGGHPERHVVTRAVGGARSIEPELISVPIRSGDRLLLCSDGLTACVADSEIAESLDAAETPDDACRSLLQRALASGAPDNVSVVAVFVGKG